MMTLVACDSSDTKKAAHPVAQAMAPSVTPATHAPASSPALQQVSAKAQLPASQQQKADPVAAIVAEVEKAYASGEENFAAGKLDAAKQDLTRALDILTQMRVDIKSDE